MKRDWDCIRAILLGLEGLGDDKSKLWSKDIDGFDAPTATHNMALLIDAGLIEGTCSNPMEGGRACVAFRMTWSGHELLDSIRQRSVWEKVKAVARERGADLTFDAVKMIGGQVIAGMLKD